MPAVLANRFVLAQCISASRGKVFPGSFFMLGTSLVFMALRKISGGEWTGGDQKWVDRNTGNKKDGRAQEGAKENKKKQKGGRKLPSMCNIL